VVELICFDEALLEPSERATDAEKNDIQVLKRDFELVNSFVFWRKLCFRFFFYKLSFFCSIADASLCKVRKEREEL